MKILYGSGIYYPKIGGAEISLMKLINCIAQNNEVLVITQNSFIETPGNTYFDKYGNRVIKILGEKSNLYNNIKAVIDDFKPDIIHGSFVDAFTFLINKISFEKNIPYIQTFCGSDVYLNPKINNESAVMTKEISDRSSALIFKSEDIKKEFISQFGNFNNINVINNGLTIDNDISLKFSSSAERYIVAIGNLRWIKGFDFLCGVSQILKLNNYKIKIKIVGSGEDLDRLQNIIKMKNLDIEIISGLSHEDTQKLLFGSEFLISTSYYEGFGNVIVEAFTFKKPVIAFNVPGVRELVINNETGILVDFPDIKEFAFKLNELFNKRDKITGMGIKAYNTVNTGKFNWNNIGSKFLSLYSNLNSNKKGVTN